MEIIYGSYFSMEEDEGKWQLGGPKRRWKDTIKLYLIWQLV
jgi:hypothetical protein